MRFVLKNEEIYYKTYFINCKRFLSLSVKVCAGLAAISHKSLGKHASRNDSENFVCVNFNLFFDDISLSEDWSTKLNDVPEKKIIQLIIIGWKRFQGKMHLWTYTCTYKHFALFFFKYKIGSSNM